MGEDLRRAGRPDGPGGIMAAVVSTLEEPGGSHASTESGRKEHGRRERDEGTRTRAGHLVVVLPGLDDEHRAELEKNVSRADMAVGKSMEGNVAPIKVGLVLYSSVFLVPVVWLIWTHAAQMSTDGAVLRLALGFGGALLCISAGLVMVAWNARLCWRTVEPSRDRPVPLATQIKQLAHGALACVLLACLIPIGVLIGAAGGSGLPGQWWLYGVDGAGVVIALVAVAWGPLALMQRRREDRFELEPFDVAVFPLCAAAAFMAERADQWRAKTVISYLAHRLESVAVGLEKAPWTRRASAFSPARHAACSRDHLTIAAYIRELIIELYGANTEAKYREVLDRVIELLVSMASADVSALSEATAHIKTVPPRIGTWVRRQAAPATVLAGLALLLPLLPGLHEQSAAVIGFRLTLGVTAFLRLLPASLSVTDAVIAAVQNAASSPPKP